MSHDKYYPCDICGHDSPSNKQTRVNGMEVSYCKRHYDKENDRKLGEKREKRDQKFKTNLIGAICDIEVDGMETN